MENGLREESFKEREERWYIEISNIRNIFKEEIARAMKCRTNKRKIALVGEWKGRYSETLCKELLNMARDRESCLRVLEWK